MGNTCSLLQIYYLQVQRHLYMNTIQKLIIAVAKARSEYLTLIAGVTEAQAEWKPSNDVWNIIDITEHLFWAEQGALYGMWKTLFAIRDERIIKSYDSIHKDLPIEQIIQQTWKEKESVPAVAAPRLGGSLAFWKASLHSLQAVLEEFGDEIKEDELRLQAHPHPISGALDFQQRIEFLNFHITRHKAQVAELLTKYQEQSK